MNLSQAEAIRIESYDYHLPEQRIAGYPLPKRDESRLLVYENEAICETVFRHLPELLPADSVLVFNNTRVIRARLHFRKETGANIEIFCLDPETPHDYARAFAQNERCRWHCLVGNRKKWKDGFLTKSLVINGKRGNLSAQIVDTEEEHSVVEFSWNNASWTFADVLDEAGELPIPPYLKRTTEASDLTTYQTVYSKVKGSVAAPTAGLHFTPEVLNSLHQKGVSMLETTLHVGAGTFKPVKSETIGEHEMHSETISISKTFIENLLATQRKVIAVGTTSLRTLESIYHLGAMLESQPDAPLLVRQWQPYISDFVEVPKQKAIQNLLDRMNRSSVDTLTADTQIIIVPGYQFRMADGLITNFHQPKSTLLLLVSAFVGGQWRTIYDYALTHNFRFLSYGDSSLLMRTNAETH